MKTKVHLFADLRYPFPDVLVEHFEGTLEECRDWAFEKTHEMLSFFPKVTILQRPNVFGGEYDFVVMSTKTKHYISFTFEEGLI